MLFRVAMCVCLLAAGEVDGQTAVPVIVMVPSARMTRSAANVTLGPDDVYAGEFTVPFDSLPSIAGTTYAMRIWIVYVESHEAFVNGRPGHTADEDWFISNTAIGAQNNSATRVNIGYVAPHPSWPMSTFNIGGSMLKAFRMQTILTSYSSSPVSFRVGIYDDGRLGSLSYNPADRVLGYIIESYAFPPQDGMSTAELVLWEQWELENPDLQAPFNPLQRQFSSFRRSYLQTDPNATGNLGMDKGGWGNDLGPGGFPESEGGADLDWNYSIPIPGSSPVVLNLNPAIFGSAIGGTNGGEWGGVVVAARQALRVFLLALLYSWAAKRVIALLQGDRFVVLGAEAHADDDEEDE